MALHHINKVVLDFSFAEKEKNDALKKTKNLFYDYALQQINAELDNTENSIYIDKLEIDLGSVSEAEFAEKFSTVFSKLVAETLHQNTESNNRKTNDIGIDEKLQLPHVVFYLINGYWQFPFQQMEEKEIEKLLTEFIKNDALVFLLFDEIRNNNEINLKRVASLFTQIKPVDRLLYFAIRNYHSYLQKTGDFFLSMYTKIVQGKTGFYEAFLYQLYKSKKLETLNDFKKFVSNFLQNYILKNEKISVINSQTISSLQQALQHSTAKIYELLPLLEKLMSQKNIIADNVFRQETASKKNVSIAEPGEDKISINNAGLVLLHPYLPYLFAELKLIDDAKNFINVSAQQKAILFLQHLINHKQKQQEHLLVLNKILCGYPIHAQIKIRHSFTAGEKAAGEEMLDSFIQHWSVLRNTSKQGLIESFIKRNGLVQKIENGFVVQVEKNSIDILLDSLPFGIRTIKLPWNEYIIYNEWTL